MSERAYHHGSLRAAMISEALEMLSAGKISDVSLRAIARNLDVAPSAAYKHFQDKDALLAAVAALGFRRLQDVLANSNPDSAPATNLMSILSRYFTFGVQNPALYKLMFGSIDYQSHPQLLSDSLAAYGLLLSCVTEASPNADVQAAAYGYWAFVHGLCLLHFSDKSDKLNFGSASQIFDRVIPVMTNFFPHT